jgi:hypothetical protein
MSAAAHNAAHAGTNASLDTLADAAAQLGTTGMFSSGPRRLSII